VNYLYTMNHRDNLELLFQYSKMGVKSKHDYAIRGWRRTMFKVSSVVWRLVLMVIGAYLSILLYGN
jgi:hypothetical protein